MENKKTKEPLLYIEQPTFSKPKAFMQENYSSLTKPKVKQPEPPVQESLVIERRRRRNPFFDLLEEEVITEVNEEESEKDRTTENNLKETKEESDDLKFNDLSIQGKIDYFINLPPEMPKMKCEIELTDDVFRGYILEDKETEIVMRTGRVNETFKKEDIKNIILIGF